MKTNFLQRSNRPRERYGFYAGAIAAALVFLAGFVFSSSTERAVHFVLSPIWKGGIFLEDNVSEFFSVFYYKQKVFEDNVALRNEVLLLEAKSIDYNALVTENKRLLEALGRKPKPAKFFASVILRPPELPYDTFMLDLGISDGVTPGDFVLAEDGSYVGHIVAAYDRTSKAILASTPGHETKALYGKTPVTFTGRGGGLLEGKVPEALNATEGDTVKLSLEGFVLGTVAKVEVDQNSSYRVVLIQNSLNIFEANSVFIAQRPK